MYIYIKRLHRHPVFDLSRASIPNGWWQFCERGTNIYIYIYNYI